MQKVAIIGLGYVGLPLACLCAEKGFEVKGFDLNKGIVEATNKGTSHIKDKFLEKKMAGLKGKITASDKPESIKGANIAIVCVPTPALDTKPDLRPLKKAVEDLSKMVEKGQLVIIESTVYPGTVEEIVQPILEKESNLKAGKDFFLGHCPERIDPGNEEFTVEKIPRVLACLSKEGTEKAKKFYKTIIQADIIVLNSVKSAEAVKVVENTFRDVNIAFVNELAKSFDRMEIDIGEVIKGASTKPFGFMPFYPGPGVGGHCIAQDPYYLIDRAHRAGFEHKFLRFAREINEGMPFYVVELVERLLLKTGKTLKDSKIAVLGIAYKPDVDDPRESPSLKIIEFLKRKGANTVSFDPFIPGKSTAKSLDEATENADCVVIATHHSQFLKKLSPNYLKEKGVKAVVDARNCLDKKAIEEAGIEYKGIGR